MATKFISRFAPSPTGRLHLGHAWSALRGFDAARAAGGRFVLRIEDIDTARCRAEFIDAIFEDLRWLGLSWDGEVMLQSNREAAYGEALAALDSMGLIYRCRCSRSDFAASAPQGDARPLYPGTCRTKSHDACLPHCWRLDSAKAAARVGMTPLAEDVVIARKDALASYHLAVTVDDAAQGVTHIVRGRDLLPVLPIHNLLQRLLGFPIPTYDHHALIVGSDGKRLAKRYGSLSLAALREAGMTGDELITKMRSGRFPIGFAIEPT